MVDPIKYSAMVQALAKSGESIKDELSNEQCHMLHMAIGISGESGELLDAIKKHAIYQKDLDVTHVIEELGDLEFYMEGLRQGLGITRELVLAANIEKLSKRYVGLTYSNEAAINRADKQN